MNMLQIPNQFEAIWNKGYNRLCPIIPPGAPISERSNIFKRIAKGDDARGKIPGIKWPDGTWSGFDFVAHESTGTDMARWNAMGAGVGVKTGNGLVLIDADTKNPQHADLIAQLVKSVIGELPLRIGQAPKAGYLCRTDAEFQYTRIEFGERNERGSLQDRVEILAEGRQFVAHGIHPVTGKPYVWPDGMPALQDVPFVPAAKLEGLLAALRPLLPSASELVREGASTDIDQSSLRMPLETLRQVVQATPNTSARFPTREAYRDYGYAIKAAAGPEHEAEGLEIYLEWASRWDDGENEPDVVEADWRRMKGPFRVGASRLLEHAGDTGRAISAGQWTEPDWRPVERSAPLFETSPPADQNLSKPLSKKFTFVSFGEAAERAISAQGKPLIKGLLDWGAMTILYGPSNVGKTFVTMDLAYHVAAGLPYGGMRTTGGAVVYVAAEGGRGVYQRVAALRRKYGDQDVPFHILPASVDLRRKDADLRPLVEAVKALGVPLALIVVDTLSRAMAGGDENSSVDMGNIVTHFDALRGATDAHLLVVHHTGKNVAQGARGHSLLRAATDTEIEISEGVFEVTKQRDLPKSWSSAFSLEVMKLGEDADGDAITSCTVRLVDKNVGGFEGELNTKEAAVYRAVSELDAFSDGANEGVTLADVEDFLARSVDKLSREIVRHSLRSLAAKRAIRKVARGKWAANRQIVFGETPPSQFVETICSGETSPNSSPNSFE